MPRTRSLAWSELKIGIVAVAALALASTIILAVGGAAGFSWQRYSLNTRFANVQGLKSGAVVRVAGVEVGKVTEVRFSGAEVEVVMDVRDDMQSRITSESRATIGSLSLLGEPVIDISPSTSGTALKDGDTVQAGRTPGQLADVAEGATQSLEQITGLLRDIRSGKGTAGKLFTDDALYKEINAFVQSAQTVARTLSNGNGTLGKLVRDPAAYESLNASLANLRDMTARINAGEGSIGRLLNDDALARSLSATTANLEQVTGRISKGEGTAGKLVSDSELYDRLNAVAGNVDRLTAELQKGQGTAGALLQDKQLYDNMNAAATELRGLIGDIRQDPKKYLNVRVSIF
jgi:phospholipid/cholesterol/gamma-HCH transport system substrate-binding protein